MWVHALADSDASCGGKAVGLARLIAAGLAVPDGFAIDTRAFASMAGELAVGPDALGHALAVAAERIATAPIDPALEREVRERAAALGLLAVRSSATIEDGHAGAAAGVFSSRRAVPLDELWDAIRAVWTSALTPLAVAYARGQRLAIGVVVQRFVAGGRLTIYTRSPAAPSGDPVIQRGDQLERCQRDDPRIAEAVLAEHAIGAGATGADVELVEDGARRWLVQARPIVRAVAPARVPPPETVLAPLHDGRIWHWDVAHNPDPLSPAQAGLVERIERAGFAPWSLRVCAGFLYSAPRSLLLARDAAPELAHRVDEPDLAHRAIEPELARRAVELEARLAAILGDDRPTLPVALARYEAFYRIWACELSPLIARSRSRIAAPIGARPSAIEATLLAAARGELEEGVVVDRLGALAPAWDVAVPTFGERPGLLRDAIERARLVERATATGDLARPAAALGVRDPSGAPAAGDLAADLAERDDVWFARAQRMVRRALLAHGAALGIGDAVFWLPLDEAVATTAIDPDDAQRRASAARSAAARAARWDMPLVVGGSPLVPGPALHGVGTGPRVTGRVVRFATLASAVAVGHGDIVVTRAVTPALAVMVIGCAAIVSETGGLLDHGAALARELGIPCIVGCHDAWRQLVDGQLVTVDGDRGTLTLTS